MIRYKLMRFIELPFNEFDQTIKVYEGQYYDNDDDCLAECKADYDTIYNIDSDTFCYYIEIDTDCLSDTECIGLAKQFDFDLTEYNLQTGEGISELRTDISCLREF